MNRNIVLEILQTVIVAFIIAFVINIARIAIFDNGDFSSLFAFNREEWLRNSNINQMQEREQRRSINSRHETEQAPRYQENEPVINNFTSDNIIEIPLEQPVCFNGMTKEQVLDLRKKAIRTSPLFSDMYYQPSRSVFSIGDGLPWISLEGALHFNKIPIEKRVEGVSRESVGILNPELLYYLSTSENEDAEDANFRALYKDFYFVPYRATYDPATKTITAYIKGERKSGNYQPIYLSDSNAHDLGYNYAHMDFANNVGYYTDEKYSSSALLHNIQPLTGYYTIGSVCGVQGGCNNYAPYWQYYNHIYLKKIPASFNIKLWKNKPSDRTQKADMNFTMVFE